MNRDANHACCTYCQNILGSISIKCAICNDIVLCLKCFSMSAEIGEHKKDHNYTIKSSKSYPIFDNENLWTFKEEKRLLQLIEQYGFGNWDEISKFMETRSANECMQHYYAYYIYGNIGKYTFKSDKKSTQESLFNIDHTKDSEITVLLPPIEMSIEEQRALGYMPLRDDFEREYKNDAECLLSNLIINNDDDETDIELKVTLTKIYRDCLLERHKFKKIAREYGLINNTSALINKNRSTLITNNTGTATAQQQQQTQEFLNSSNVVIKQTTTTTIDDDKNDLNEKYKKFAQICTVSTYETLLESMRKRKQIVNRIEELNKYRDLGIKSFKEIDEYKNAKVARDKKKELEKKNSTSRANATTLQQQHQLSPTKKLLNSSSKSFDLISADESTDNSIATHLSNSTSSTCSNSSTHSMSNDSLEQNLMSNRNGGGCGIGRTERLCSMSGYNLLSENEKKLVSSLNMKPTLYITFKTFLIKTSIARRHQRQQLLKKEIDSNNNNGAGTMLLRRQSSNNLNASSITTSTAKLKKNSHHLKLINSCPNYLKISYTARKRILRFLCDNGWIDIS